MPKYLPAERTARKARKQARQEAAAEAQQEQETRRLAIIARMEVLEAEQQALAAETKSKKNCARRKAVRRSAASSPKQLADLEEPVEYTVVHGSASCEEEDEDVIDLHAFLEPGINPKIDEAFEAQQAAQMAMQDMVRGSSDDSSHDVPVPAVKAGSQALLFAEAQQRYNQLHSPPFFSPELPALASASELQAMDAAAAAALAPSVILFANKKRGTARMECSRNESSDEDVIFDSTTASSTSHHNSRARDSDGILIDHLERREEEEEDERAVNNSYHDERVVRIVEAGYLLREAISALAATKQGGLESTPRACKVRFRVRFRV